MSDQPPTALEAQAPTECCQCAAYRRIIIDQANEPARVRECVKNADIHSVAALRYLKQSVPVLP